jgi:hypothetical protein
MKSQFGGRRERKKKKRASVKQTSPAAASGVAALVDVCPLRLSMYWCGSGFEVLVSCFGQAGDGAPITDVIRNLNLVVFEGQSTHVVGGVL